MDAVQAGLDFAELAKGCGERGVQPELDRACMLISAVFDGEAEVEVGLAQLDALADRARAIAGSATDSYAIAGAAIEAIFREAAFRPNAADYNDPRNNLLSSVLRRRTGIPITLSIVLMEIARRLGLPLRGIGLPGHFVVAFPDATSRLFIDAYDGGRILDAVDCVRLVERQPVRITWTDRFLDPVAPRLILKRVLLNLKNALSHAKNYGAALTAIELQLALDPDDPTELRDRGILFARLHRYDRAIADLEAYLERSPDAADVKQIRDKVLWYLREARNL
ncbi:MAG TPA: transglutaminase-like domain-containing protein [Candidatus Eremiobacteraceae bacterium]|nr:transglutaminase-like domain-containing protein [Candidatus Eremiobacteraceae bacterium]